MTGKYSSLRDAVVHRASLDGFDDTIGSVGDYGLHHTFVKDLYGKHYIVTENDQGFVEVEAFAATFVDHDGVEYRSAEAGNRWLELSDAYDAWAAAFDNEEE